MLWCLPQDIYHIKLHTQGYIKSGIFNYYYFREPNTWNVILDCCTDILVIFYEDLFSIICCNLDCLLLIIYTNVMSRLQFSLKQNVHFCEWVR